MEEDREILKHSCKLCNKSFPCGRSLGGHMRSHMINSNNNSADVKFPKKKLPSVSEMAAAAAAASYSLRENPKKTRRLVDTSGDTPPLLYDKACNKESVKGKTLFGSLEKETTSLEEDQDSWTGANNQKLVMDGQSDNETAAPNRRRRRSKRRTRYMATANSSSFSNNNNTNVSSSVSEIEQEQEEVAMCLMMLSRDLGGGPRVCLNSVAESSDNNSVFLEAKVGDAGDKRCQFDETEKNSELDQPQLGGGSKKLVSDAALKNNNSATIGFKDSSHKRSKFECTTCNKIFHSYQALGGHRASHKKIKGCFATKIDSNENSIETQLQQLSPDPTADSSKIVKPTTNDNSIDHLVTADCEEKFDQTSTTYGPKKRHECPICLKVFSSGQALGGHKRSHLLNVTDQAARSNSSTIAIDKPMPEIRNFLDLNLPAPAEEESSSGHLAGFKPWWIDSSHKHEALVGLISN